MNRLSEIGAPEIISSRDSTNDNHQDGTCISDQMMRGPMNGESEMGATGIISSTKSTNIEKSEYNFDQCMDNASYESIRLAAESFTIENESFNDNEDEHEQKNSFENQHPTEPEGSMSEFMNNNRCSVHLDEIFQSIETSANRELEESLNYDLLNQAITPVPTCSNKSGSNINRDESEIRFDLQGILASVEILRKEAARLDYRISTLDKIPISEINIDDVQSFELENDNRIQKPSELKVALDLNLPLETVDVINEFETKLKDTEFRNIVVSFNESFLFVSCYVLYQRSLERINTKKKKFQINHLEQIFSKSTSLNMKQALLLITNTLISPKLLSNFTWTGKSGTKSGPKKQAFRQLNEIISLIFDIMQRFDDKYTIEKLHKDITYNVLKYAYKFQKQIID